MDETSLEATDAHAVAARYISKTTMPRLTIRHRIVLASCQATTPLRPRRITVEPRRLGGRPLRRASESREFGQRDRDPRGARGCDRRGGLQGRWLVDSRLRKA